MENVKNFDILNNLDWDEETRWGVKYLDQFDTMSYSFEDLTGMLWQGIIKRRTGNLQADIAVTQWNNRHPDLKIPTPTLDRIKSNRFIDPDSVRSSAFLFASVLTMYGSVIGDENLIKVSQVMAAISRPIN